MFLLYTWDICFPKNSITFFYNILWLSDQKYLNILILWAVFLSVCLNTPIRKQLKLSGVWLRYYPHIMHYLHFEEYSNRLELMSTALKLMVAGSSPRKDNIFSFLFFPLNIIYVSLWAHLVRKNCFNLIIKLLLVFIG
jgi:hypothetical protein